MEVETISKNLIRPSRLIGRSALIGLAVGLMAASVFTIDTTIRQPNFVPASFAIALLWIFPYLLGGGLAIGALIGLTSGALAIPILRFRHWRVAHAAVFLAGMAVAIALVTHPTLWASHAPTNLLVMVLSATIVIVGTRRWTPRSAH